MDSLPCFPFWRRPASVKEVSKLPGPYLQAAILCEKAIEGKDDTLSLIRLIDTIEVSAKGEGVPEQMPQVEVSLTAVIMLKSGDFRGEVPVRIEFEVAGKPVARSPELPTQLKGDELGQNLIVNLGVRVHEPGLYWFAVYLGTQLATKMPLRVRYAPSAT